jgi:hypothetical protein
VGLDFGAWHSFAKAEAEVYEESDGGWEAQKKICKESGQKETRRKKGDTETQEENYIWIEREEWLWANAEL